MLLVMKKKIEITSLSAYCFIQKLCNCKAVVLIVDAGRFRNSNDGFLNAPALSEGCNSVDTTLRNLSTESDSGLNKVS